MRKPAILFALVALLAGLAVFIGRRGSPASSAETAPSPAPTAPSATAASPTTTVSSQRVAAPADPANVATSGGSTAPSLVAGPHAPTAAAAVEAMHEAMVSYDPANLPIIVRYLNHADPELRSTALENILQMGDAAAAPLLRQASDNALSPKEALAMLDAADYLELPADKDLWRRAKAKKSTSEKNSRPARSQKKPEPESPPAPENTEIQNQNP